MSRKGGCSGVASSIRKAKDKTLTHIHTLYLWKTRQLVKRRRMRRQRRLRCQACSSLSLSLAASRGVSGQHFQALTRWLPDFLSQVPAGIMRAESVRKITPAVQMIECMCSLHILLSYLLARALYVLHSLIHITNV